MGVHRVTLLSSAARTANGTGSITDHATMVGGSSQFSSALFYLNVTAVSGTLPTLDCYIQTEMPNEDYEDAIAFGQVSSTTKRRAILLPGNVMEEGLHLDTALTASSTKGVPLGAKWRVKWIIGGTLSPSFTFDVTADFYD